MDDGTQPHQYALLVEDDELANRSMVQFLREQGFMVISAQTYDEAVTHLKNTEYAFQLAILDILIGQGDGQMTRKGPFGLNIARQLKQRSRETAIVFWTAYAQFMPDVVTLLLERHSGIACVGKGSQAEVLQDAIQQALRGVVYLHQSSIDVLPMRADLLLLASLPPDVADSLQMLADRLALLSPRERDVVDHLCRTTDVIAETLMIKGKSVLHKLDDIYDRLGIKNEVESFQGLRRDTLLVLATLLERLRKG